MEGELKQEILDGKSEIVNILARLEKLENELKQIQELLKTEYSQYKTEAMANTSKIEPLGYSNEGEKADPLLQQKLEKTVLEKMELFYLP